MLIIKFNRYYSFDIRIKSAMDNQRQADKTEVVFIIKHHVLLNRAL